MLDVHIVLSHSTSWFIKDAATNLKVAREGKFLLLNLVSTNSHLIMGSFAAQWRLESTLFKLALSTMRICTFGYSITILSVLMDGWRDKPYFKTGS